MSKLQFGTESNSNSKHRWYNEIVAWANGEKIQYRASDWPNWLDYIHPSTQDFMPDFNNLNFIWRIKPKMQIKQYKMALVLSEDKEHAVIAVDITHSSLDFPAEQSIPGFIRWVGQFEEVEMPANAE